MSFETRRGGLRGWTGRHAVKLPGPDVCSSSRPGAHLQSFELTGGIPLLLHVSIYFAPLNPQLGTMSWLAASLSSSSHVSLYVSRTVFRTTGRSGSDPRRRGIFCVEEIKKGR